MANVKYLLARILHHEELLIKLIVIVGAIIAIPNCASTYYIVSMVL